MSMMGKKQKNQPFVVNPCNIRNDAWTNDTNKIGQKMLEAMGWSAGEGLGKTNQGDVDLIKLHEYFKSQGLGFERETLKPYETPKPYHFKVFEQVIASLNEMTEEEQPVSIENDGSINSLEERSKLSKSRLHYAKFTRGKDLSLYTEADISSIFGTNEAVSRKCLPKQDSKISCKDDSTSLCKEDSTISCKEDSTISCKEDSTSSDKEDSVENASFTYRSNINLKVYFDEKMAELKRKRNEGLLADNANVADEQNSIEETDSFPDLALEPQIPDFSFNFGECNTPQKSKNDEEIMQEVPEEEEYTKLKKKKKSSKTKNQEYEKREKAKEIFDIVDKENQSNQKILEPNIQNSKLNEISTDSNRYFEEQGSRDKEVGNFIKNKEKKSSSHLKKTLSEISKRINPNNSYLAAVNKEYSKSESAEANRINEDTQEKGQKRKHDSQLSSSSLHSADGNEGKEQIFARLKPRKAKLFAKESFRCLAADVERFCSKVRKSKTDLGMNAASENVKYHNSENNSSSMPEEAKMSSEKSKKRRKDV